MVFVIGEPHVEIVAVEASLYLLLVVGVDVALLLHFLAGVSFEVLHDLGEDLEANFVLVFGGEF